MMKIYNLFTSQYRFSEWRLLCFKFCDKNYLFIDKINTTPKKIKIKI